MRKVRRRKGEPLKGWIIRGLKDTDDTMNNSINLEGNQSITDFDAIPAELRILDRWICWKHEMRNQKPTKVSYNATSLKRASCENPSTWTSFEGAKRCYLEHPEFDGIGVVFTAEDNFTGVDLDDCLDEGNKLADWAHPYLNYSCPLTVKLAHQVRD